MIKKLLFGYFILGSILIVLTIFKAPTISTFGYGLLALFVMLTTAISGFFFLIELTEESGALNILYLVFGLPTLIIFPAFAMTEVAKSLPAITPTKQNEVVISPNESAYKLPHGTLHPSTLVKSEVCKAKIGGGDLLLGDNDMAFIVEHTERTVSSKSKQRVKLKDGSSVIIGFNINAIVAKENACTYLYTNSFSHGANETVVKAPDVGEVILGAEPTILGIVKSASEGFTYTTLTSVSGQASVQHVVEQHLRAGLLESGISLLSVKLTFTKE